LVNKEVKKKDYNIIDKSRRIPRVTSNKIEILRSLQKKSMRKGVTLIREIEPIIYIKNKDIRLTG